MVLPQDPSTDAGTLSSQAPQLRALRGAIALLRGGGGGGGDDDAAPVAVALEAPPTTPKPERLASAGASSTRILG